MAFEERVGQILSLAAQNESLNFMFCDAKCDPIQHTTTPEFVVLTNPGGKYTPTVVREAKTPYHETTNLKLEETETGMSVLRMSPYMIRDDVRRKSELYLIAVLSSTRGYRENASKAKAKQSTRTSWLERLSSASSPEVTVLNPLLLSKMSHHLSPVILECSQIYRIIRDSGSRGTTITWISAPSSIVTSQVVIIRGVVLVIESHNVLHNHLRQMEKACEPRRVGAAVSGATPGGGCLSVGLDRVIHSLAVAG